MAKVREKVCADCCRIKHVILFPVDAKASDGRGSTCNQCKNDADKRKAKR